MSQSKIHVENVSRRPVRDTDRAFLLRVFASYMERTRELMAAGIPDEHWDQVVANQFELQHSHYREAWSEGGTFEVIELKGKPIGRLYLWRGLDQGVEQIQIVEFTLLTEYRNQGIGSHLLQQVLAWADDEKLPVRTRLGPLELSQPFLKRHGFTLFKDEGPSLQFQRLPGTAVTSAVEEPEA